MSVQRSKNCRNVNTVGDAPWGSFLYLATKQGSTISTKLPYVITYLCQNFGVCDIHGQIPKSIYQVSYLLTSDFPVLQIKAGQQSITANLCPLTTHIYHVMIIVTVCFSKKSFLLLSLLLFPRNSFVNDLELAFLEFKHFYKIHRISMFSFYLFIFYLLFRNHFILFDCV